MPDEEIPKQAWPSEESEGNCVTVTDVSEENRSGVKEEGAGGAGAGGESGNES